MINRVVLVGRLTRDPESRNGGSIAVFTVAIDNLGKEKSTSFIPCVVLNPQRAETVIKFARKGLLVGVEGRLNQRSYQKNDGTKASVIEVIADSVQFLEKREQVENEEMDIPPFDDITASSEDDNKNLDSIEITDDDLPF
jgi:single-strand DNA-binding protein